MEGKVRETFFTASPEETEALGAALMGRMRAVVFALYGDLGAGKTALVRGAAAALGDFSAASPTFSILHEYVTNPTIYHFDLYRLTGEEDLEAVGYFEALDAEGIVFIEWPDRAGDFLPKERVDIRLETMKTVQGNQRKIVLEDDCGLLDPA